MRTSAIIRFACAVLDKHITDQPYHSQLNVNFYRASGATKNKYNETLNLSYYV